MAKERRRVQATLPVESRSQADSEAADVDEDRDKGNTKEIANKLKGPGRPHLTASALRPRRGRGLPVGGEEAGARRAQDTAAELQAPSSAPAPGHGSQGEGQQGCKALEVAKRDQFKATLLQHNNNVELLELRYRIRGPDSRIQWAAEFSQLPQRRIARRLRRLLQGARAQPGLRRTWGSETPVSRACSRGPGQPGWTLTSQSAPAGCHPETVQRSFVQAYPHWSASFCKELLKAPSLSVPSRPEDLDSEVGRKTLHRAHRRDTCQSARACSQGTGWSRRVSPQSLSLFQRIS